MRKKERVKSVAIVGLVMVIILLSCAVIKSNQEKDYYKTLAEEKGIEDEQVMDSFMAGGIARCLDGMYSAGYVQEDAYKQLITLEEEFIEDPSYSKLQIYLNFALELLQHAEHQISEESL